MKTDNDGSKVVLIVFLVLGLFFFMPVLFILLVDGFSGFIIMPIMMFAIMGIAFLFIFRVAKKSVGTANKNRTFQRDVVRHCIHCHESIEAFHKFCPICGEEQTNYIVCDYCGHENNLQNLQCEECNALIK